jgi:hypothetical protein
VNQTSREDGSEKHRNKGSGKFSRLGLEDTGEKLNKYITDVFDCLGK